MSYQKFTSLKSAVTKFSLDVRYEPLFDAIKPLPPSTRLQEDLAEAELLPTRNEKAKSEYIVVPVLKEMWRNANRSVVVFSGAKLTVDAAQGLDGYCDFIIAKSPFRSEIQAPLLCVVEAKKEDLESGLGQCTAEMVAARIFNERDGAPLPAIYGCVTTALEWLFLRLEGTTLTIDTHRYSLTNVPELLGALQTVIDFYKS